MYAQGRFLLSGLPLAGESIGITPLSFYFTNSTGTTPSNAIYIGDISTVSELAQRITSAINSNDVPGTASFNPTSVTFTPYSRHEQVVAICSQASNISVEGIGASGFVIIGSPHPLPSGDELMDELNFYKAAYAQATFQLNAITAVLNLDSK